ncbi:hypothetical protein JW968_01680, partial [Candidatus Woesearchaeota archaeon]|nr:hypothetical protein [Candidatus Woesearchaeota archaeon]
ELVFNGTEWCYEYIFTNTTWIGVYNITLNATDELGNWNRTYTNFTIQDVIDMIPPNLTNITSEPISPVLNNGSEENISVNLTSDEYPINVTFLLYNWSGVIVDVQGPHVVQNSSVLPLTYTVPLGLADGNYTLNLTATDQYNNSVEVFVAVIEVVYPDTTPPGSIANLQSLSQTNSSIFWNWSNPVDADFNGTVIFINDSWVANLSAPVNFVNVTGLLSDTNYIITIHTRDHVGNVNDTGVSNINKTLANPVVDTDPPIFITVEPAGDVFNQSDDVMIIACVDENVTIAANVSWDSTYESAELVFNGTEWCYEYVFTNTSWPGLYDISLNATDVYGNWNVTETNFTIQDVTAPAVDILEPSSGSSIDQNDSVSIIINVTDPYHNNMGTVIANVTWDSTYEEINLVYNSTSGLWGGVFSDTTMLGEYNITIIATDNDGNRNESDTRFTVTDVQAEISTGYDIYAPDIEVEINGTGFSLNANVTINITNATSVIYTNLTTTDGAGEFSIIWLNSGTAEGDYTIIAADQYGRTANKTIQIITNYSFNGKIFDVNNNTWPADIRVYNSTGDLIAVDDELYNLTFDYGAEYDIFVYPHNNPLIQMLDFKYVANQGFLEDFLGLDYLLGFSDGTQYLEMGSYLPALTNYEYVIVTLQNQYNYGVEVFKCADYNFTGRDCLGLWDNIINMTKYQTINVTVYPGDPAFAAKKIDEGGSGTGGGSGGAGGGGGYTGLCSAKYYGCTEWSECTDGVQTRDCYFIYNCDPDSKRLMNESAELHETNGISEAWQLKELEQRKCAETEAGIEEPKDIELIEQMLSPVVSNAKKTGYYLVDKLGSARFRWMLYILLLTCISIVLNVYLNHDPEKMKKF